MLSLHKCRNCGFDKYGKFLTKYDNETGIETMVCPKCLITGHPSLFLKTNEEIKTEEKNSYHNHDKKKAILELKIAFGLLITIIVASSIMGAISNHFESKSIRYRNSIIKPDTNSSYESTTTENSCEDEALGEFEANHGAIVDNEYEVSAMASILKKHCGY